MNTRYDASVLAAESQFAREVATLSSNPLTAPWEYDKSTTTAYDAKSVDASLAHLSTVLQSRAQHKISADVDKSNTPVWSSPSRFDEAQSHAGSKNKKGGAIRNEIKALQDGLIQLKAALANRKSRSLPPHRVPPERHRTAILDKSRRDSELTMDRSNPMATHYKRIRQPDMLPEDCVSQTDSAAPSALQVQVLQGMQSLARRLDRLEEERELNQSQADDASSLPNRGIFEAAGSATLSSELALERMQRIRLEAIVRALCKSQRNLDVSKFLSSPKAKESGSPCTRDVTSEEEGFNLGAIETMSEEELKIYAIQLTDRMHHLVRQSIQNRSAAIELDSALRSIKDLSVRIAELENRLMGRVDGPPYTEGSVKDKSAELTIQVRVQSSRIRALLKENAVYKSAFEGRAFEVVGDGDSAFLEALKIVLANQSLPKVGKKSQSPSPTSNSMNYGKEESPALSTSQTSSSNARLLWPAASVYDTTLTVVDSTPVNGGVAYTPVSDDPIDCAIGNWTNTRENRILFTRLRKGVYAYGMLNVRVTLSARSRTPLVFYDDKKYSLKRFVELFETQEFDRLEHAMLAKSGALNLEKKEVLGHVTSTPFYTSAPRNMPAPTRGLQPIRRRNLSAVDAATHKKSLSPDKRPLVREQPRLALATPPKVRVTASSSDFTSPWKRTTASSPHPSLRPPTLQHWMLQHPTPSG